MCTEGSHGMQYLEFFTHPTREGWEGDMASVPSTVDGRDWLLHCCDGDWLLDNSAPRHARLCHAFVAVDHLPCQRKIIITHSLHTLVNSGHDCVVWCCRFEPLPAELPCYSVVGSNPT